MDDYGGRLLLGRAAFCLTHQPTTRRPVEQDKYLPIWNACKIVGAEINFIPLTGSLHSWVGDAVVRSGAKGVGWKIVHLLAFWCCGGSLASPPGGEGWNQNALLHDIDIK